jgi:hypothetical protein
MVSGRRWLFLLVLAVVVIVNLVQFRAIDAPHHGEGYAALGRQPSSEIMTLARANARIGGTYGMYLDLRDASPRSQITGAEEGVIPPARLRDTALGIGDATEVRIVDFDDAAAPLPEQLLADGGSAVAHGLLRRDEFTDMPWQLITGECGAEPGPTDAFAEPQS